MAEILPPQTSGLSAPATARRAISLSESTIAQNPWRKGEPTVDVAEAESLLRRTAFATGEQVPLPRF